MISATGHSKGIPFEQLVPDRGVAAEQLDLARPERTRPREDLGRHVDLADVVQQPCPRASRASATARARARRRSPTRAEPPGAGGRSCAGPSSRRPPPASRRWRRARARGGRSSRAAAPRPPAAARAPRCSSRVRCLYLPFEPPLVQPTRVGRLGLRGHRCGAGQVHRQIRSGRVRGAQTPSRYRVRWLCYCSEIRAKQRPTTASPPIWCDARSYSARPACVKGKPRPAQCSRNHVGHGGSERATDEGPASSVFVRYSLKPAWCLAHGSTPRPVPAEGVDRAGAPALQRSSNTWPGRVLRARSAASRPSRRRSRDRRRSRGFFLQQARTLGRARRSRRRPTSVAARGTPCRHPPAPGLSSRLHGSCTIRGGRFGLRESRSVTPGTLAGEGSGLPARAESVASDPPDRERSPSRSFSRRIRRRARGRRAPPWGLQSDRSPATREATPARTAACVTVESREIRAARPAAGLATAPPARPVERLPDGLTETAARERLAQRQRALAEAPLLGQLVVAGHVRARGPAGARTPPRPRDCLRRAAASRHR